MTAERTAKIVARWVRFYTRELPAPIAERRRNEVDADLHDHIAHERAQGTSETRISLGLLSRMTRGMAADKSWRSRYAQAAKTQPSTTGEAMKSGNAYRSIVRVLLAAALILALPFLAMQVTNEVVWTLGDFVIAGALLVGTGLLYEVAARRMGSLTYRAAVGVALGAGLCLVWAVLAVGAIGAVGDPADLMYFGVLGIGIVGAVSVRLQPDGMARVLLVMAFALALVAVVALIAGKHLAPQSSVVEILGVNAFFATLFMGSAWLFRRSAREQPRAGSAQPPAERG